MFLSCYFYGSEKTVFMKGRRGDEPFCGESQKCLLVKGGRAGDGRTFIKK